MSRRQGTPYGTYGRGKRRGDPVPLLIHPDNGGAWVEAIGAFFRWLWRYRSELAPFTTLFAVMVIGWWLHRVHPSWWPVPALLAASAVAVLAWPHRVLVTRFGLLRRTAQRWWAGGLVTVTGGWLMAATLVGPGTPPLPTLAVVAMVGFGCPWWASRERVRRVRIRRVVERFPDTAESAGLPGAKVVSADIGRWGWTARVRLRAGQHFRHVVNALPALESALGTRVGALRAEPVPTDAAKVVLRIIETDPHAKPIPYPSKASFAAGDDGAGGRTGGAVSAPDGPGSGPGGSGGSGQSGRWSIRQPVPLGVWEDGEPVTVSLLRRHALIGGTTGAGKSGLLNVILARLVACNDVRLWGIDLKGGMELRPWAPCLERLAVTGTHAAVVLRAGVEEVERRAQMMAHTGQREWTPTPSRPALVIVVDEYAELPDAVRSLADSIARLGRAVAVTLLVATQRPTQKAMGQGSAIRSQMDVRLCLRVRESRDVDLILGQGMLGRGWDTSGFDAPGKFRLSAPGHDIPRRALGYWLSDKQVAAIVKENMATNPATRDDARNSTAGPRAINAGDNTNPSGPADPAGSVSGPDVALWAALWDAPASGVTVGHLVSASGMSRASVYRRLSAALEAGEVERSVRGRWRAKIAPTDPTDSPPSGSPGPT